MLSRMAHLLVEGEEEHNHNIKKTENSKLLNTTLKQEKNVFQIQTKFQKTSQHLYRSQDMYCEFYITETSELNILVKTIFKYLCRDFNI